MQGPGRDVGPHRRAERFRFFDHDRGEETGTGAPCSSSGPPRAKTPSRKRPAVQRENGAPPIVSPAAFLEALRAERAKIDTAIAAVEALA